MDSITDKQTWQKKTGGKKEGGHLNLDFQKWLEQKKTAKATKHGASLPKKLPQEYYAQSF